MGLQMNTKASIANNDINLLLKPGNIAFYKSCEITHFFITNKTTKEVSNYYTLFVFEELENFKKETKYLFKSPISIDDNHSLGALQKRISVEEAKALFQSIQQGKMDFTGPCNISSQMKVLPKTIVSQKTEKVFINKILKNNVWGDNYIIEFFDEAKNFPLSENTRDKINSINDKIKKTTGLDLAFIYDRIGNIIFQFPITLVALKTGVSKDGLTVKISCKPHPHATVPKNIIVQTRTHLDNAITGFSTKFFHELNFTTEETIGDDNDIQISISDYDNNLLISDTRNIKFIKSVQSNFHIINTDEPRIIPQRDGSTKEIQTIDSFISNIGESYHSQNYRHRITDRNTNNEVLTHSGDYIVLKGKQREEALEFIRNKIKNSPNTKEVCLWDPYLDAYDIMNTLYYEPTGKVFRCISCTSKAYHIHKEEILHKSDISAFDAFRKYNQTIFKLSNNKKINLKFLAQHDNYGLKFHDRFLILVPFEETRMPEVYSLGISINQIGESHHIIQKVTNSREILKNFEELWLQLNNEDCCIVDFPKMLSSL